MKTRIVQSNGPVVRATPVDPLLREIWPIACALAWIRAVGRGLSVDERDGLIRQAFAEDAKAFPAVDPPIDEGRMLLDFAAGNPSRLKLYGSDGEIGLNWLGPDAVILPTVVHSHRHTFGLWPWPYKDISHRVLSLWCLASEVRDGWSDHCPASKLQREQPVANKARRGRKPSYHWGEMKAEAMRLLEHHNEFSDDDPEWNGPEKLISALQKFYQEKFGVDPPERSTVQGRMGPWLSEWRAAKSSDN